ncbi:hypothetical protein Q8A67_012402 [Cirrhinus molitorella]|uniref:C-type lectin domain-containing protein n=1 Tax=Cirrhinus molitorella TaxID=172907 RepID=A0AA88TVU9_9TELE|nr:hypothetical protein Q8A67_012402 [Cirrhinus molitorella]
MSRRLSDSSDDSSASDKSSELPPLFNCDGNQEESFQWKLEDLNDELKKLIEELNSDFDKNHPGVTSQIKKLQNTTNELESMHKKITVGSLTGASLGAAGGITSIAGLCLAPFTFGVSLALVGVGTAVGVAGGATTATCTITKMIIPKNLCETIKNIIEDVQNTIKSMIEQLNEIYDNIEDIEQLEETMEKEGVTTVRSAIDISDIKNEIGNVSALAVKDMLVFVQNANVASAVVDAAKAAYVATQTAKVAHAAADTAKFARVAGAATGVLSDLDSQLILIKENLTWSEALRYCRQNHVDLVSVHSEEIQRRVMNVVKGASTAAVWLGLHNYCIMNMWLWVSGEMVCYHNWAPGNGTTQENCKLENRKGAVQSGGDQTWISLPESHKLNFICSRE